MRLSVFLTCVACVVVAATMLTTTNPALAGGLDVYLEFDGNLNDTSGSATTYNGTWVDGDACTHAYVTAPNATQGINIGMAAGYSQNTAYTNTDYVQLDYTLADSGTICFWYLCPYDAELPDGLDGSVGYATLWDCDGSPNATPGLEGDTWEGWLQDNGRMYIRPADGGPTAANERWNGEPQSYARNDADDAVGESCDGHWVFYAATWHKYDGVPYAPGTSFGTPSSMRMSMYVNGVYEDERSYTDGAPWMDTDDVFYIGGGNDGNRAGIGTYDNFAIFSTELSQAEIQDIYVNGITPVPEPGTLTLLLAALASLAAVRLARR